MTASRARARLRPEAPRRLLLTIVAVLLAGCDGAWLDLAGRAEETDAQRTPVVFISNGPPASLPAEESAALEWARAQADLDVDVVQLADLAESRLARESVVWWHYAEGPALPSSAVRPETMAAVRRHLGLGGGVLLTLLASSYVVPLGLETAPPDQVTNAPPGEGFDQTAAGLQARLGHPILRRFWGGTDTATLEAGRPVGSARYTGDRWPERGRVWAVERRDGTVDQQSKIGIEYPPTSRLGGTLVTVGAHLYFAAPENRHRPQLEALMRSLVSYLATGETRPPPGADIPALAAESPQPTAGDGETAPPTADPELTVDSASAAGQAPEVLTDTSYWDAEPASVDLPLAVAIASDLVPRTDRRVLEAVQAASSGLALTRTNPVADPFTLASPRALAIGTQHGRVAELWTHPVRVLRDLRFAVVSPGSPPVWLDAAAGERRFTARPEADTFSYQGSGIRVDLHLAVDRDGSALVALLDIEASAPVQVLATWTAEQEAGWRSATPLARPVQMAWDETGNAALWTDPGRTHVAIAGFGRETTAHVLGFDPELHLAAGGLQTEPGTEESPGPPTPTTAIAIQTPFDPARDAVLPFVVVGAHRRSPGLGTAYAELLSDPALVWLENARHFQGVVTETTAVTTPTNPAVNSALAWARTGLDALRLTVPRVGSGLARGYGPTDAGSDPPGYGSAALWGVLAANSIGDFELARDTLRLLARYRGEDGRIADLMLPTWNSSYSTPDGTPLFLMALADYVQSSGDTAVLDELWPAAEAALELCLATERDPDGLPRAGAGGWPWQEDPLFATASTTIATAGLWSAGLRAGETLASVRGETAIAERAAAAAEELQQQLNSLFWSPTDRFFRFGATAEGPPIDTRTILPALPMALGLLNPGEATALLEPFGGAELITDWGARLRARPDLDVEDLPGATARVRPLFTGWAALAHYAGHDGVGGYLQAASNLELVRHTALGSLPAALDDDRFAIAPGATHDVAAQAMAILPILRGMLGLRIDAVAGTVTMLPHLPGGWNRVVVSPLRVGADAFRVVLVHTPERTQFLFDRLSGERPLQFTLGASVPADVLINHDRDSSTGVALLGDERINYTQLDRAAVVTVVPTEGRFVVAFEHELYPELIPQVPILEAEAASVGHRILQARYSGGVLRVALEGLPGRTVELDISTPWPIESVSGVPSAAILRAGPGEGRVAATLPGSGSRYLRVEMEVAFRR